MMSKSESNTLGELFGETKPKDKRKRRGEYWYWEDEATVGKMHVTRDGLGRFVEFHRYEPRVIHGEPTKQEMRAQKNSLGELFG